MKERALIRRMSDGAEATHEYDWGEGYGPSNVEFMWTDGNYGCDCNRGLFFKRARNEDEGDEKCGHSEYRVRVYADEEVVVDEWGNA